MAQERFYVAKVDRVVTGGRLLLLGGTMVILADILVPDNKHERPTIRQLAGQAEALVRKWIEGKTVRIEFTDTVEGPRQGYVFQGGKMINAHLLEQGLAVMTDTNDSKGNYHLYLLESQIHAMKNKVGIWQIDLTN